MHISFDIAANINYSLMGSPISFLILFDKTYQQHEASIAGLKRSLTKKIWHFEWFYSKKRFSTS
jgi:hypothetical protein